MTPCKQLLQRAALQSMVLALGVCAAFSAFADIQLDKIRLPEGFKIEVYADDVLSARSMTLGDDGTLYVGTRESGGKGKVYAIPDRDKDGKSDEVIEVARHMFMPNGVAYRDGSLYVAEVNRVLRWDNIAKNLANPGIPAVVNANFSGEKHHGWKFIRFGPDGKLYVPVGAPCNVCIPEEEGPYAYATIMRMDPDGSNLEVFAEGVRNTVGFDWDPKTGDLWFTDNNADNRGATQEETDNMPPGELNHAPEQGMHFGFPYCHGGEYIDNDVGAGRSCEEFTSPAVKLGPHVAGLGMRFYTGSMFPEQYKNVIFVAEHGSWNRTEKIGYRITMISEGADGTRNYGVFAQGWLQEEEAWGRPVDVQVMPDGALLVSDDHAGAIYRISYGG
jgi:glucose/arabinose dehydrogenase